MAGALDGLYVLIGGLTLNGGTEVFGPRRGSSLSSSCLTFSFSFATSPPLYPNSLLSFYSNFSTPLLSPLLLPTHLLSLSSLQPCPLHLSLSDEPHPSFPIKRKFSHPWRASVMVEQGAEGGLGSRHEGGSLCFSNFRQTSAIYTKVHLPPLQPPLHSNGAITSRTLDRRLEGSIHTNNASHPLQSG